MIIKKIWINLKIENHKENKKGVILNEPLFNTGKFKKINDDFRYVLSVWFDLVSVLPIDDIIYAIIAILPAGITGLLVFPIPNYHNVLTVLIAMWNFFTTRQKYIWKGWCVTNEYKDEK